MNSKTILLTGITGNLGAYAARQFLEKGVTIYALSRGRRHTLKKRMIDSMLTYGPFNSTILEALKRGKLIPIKADITSRDSVAGIRLPCKINATWHFASSLRYLAKDREKIEAVNIDGLTNILHLHESHEKKDSIFNYISTAFIGGKNYPVVDESYIPFTEDLAFNNEYERTKLIAEGIIFNAIKSGKIKGNIYRPSIVVGDKNNGKLINYHGYYLALKAIIHFKEFMKNKKNDQKKIRLFIHSNNSYNLIPVDDVTDMMLTISETNPDNGMFFNCVNGHEALALDVVKIVNKMLNLKVDCVDNNSFKSVPKTKFEKLLHFTQTYLFPYGDFKVKFKSDNVTHALGKSYALKLTPNILDMLNQNFYGIYKP